MIPRTCPNLPKRNVVHGHVAVAVHAHDHVNDDSHVNAAGFRALNQSGIGELCEGKLTISNKSAIQVEWVVSSPFHFRNGAESAPAPAGREPGLIRGSAGPAFLTCSVLIFLPAIRCT